MLPEPFTGHLLKRDGTPCKGSVYVVPRSTGASPSEKKTFPVDPILRQLDAEGKFSISLQPNNAPDAEPSGWTYEVRLQIDGAPTPMWFDLDLPAAGGAGVDLASVIPVDPAYGSVTDYVLTAELAAEAALREAADAEEAEAREAADVALSGRVEDLEAGSGPYDPAGAAAAAQAAAASDATTKANAAVISAVAAAADDAAVKASAAQAGATAAAAADATTKANAAQAAAIAAAAADATTKANAAQAAAVASSLQKAQNLADLASAGTARQNLGLGSASTQPSSAFDPAGAAAAAQAAAVGAAAKFAQWAGNPDALIVGTITRDTNGAATSAPVVWPDGAPGTYTATTVSAAFPGAVDAYTITYGSPVTSTYTQPAVTRNSSGAVTARPAIVVS